MWINIIFLATIFNGIALASMKAVHQYSQSESIGIFFISMYITSVLLGIINLKSKLIDFSRNEILIGISLGISLISGMMCVTFALKYLQGNFVYPVVNGGAVILISIIAGILFKEKYSVFGVLGIIIGTTSIIFLSL